MSSDDAVIADIGGGADRQLLWSVAKGSAEALSDLYDRHAGTVFSLARRILGQSEDAEEVVQDVFAQVWRQAARYEASRASVAGWIVMLARTRAIDRLRASRARPDQRPAMDVSDAPALLVDDRSPEGVTISAAEAALVREALGTLPDVQRALVELAYFEGLTHSEICGRTGMPLGTVKTRLRTAMSTLRGALRR